METKLTNEEIEIGLNLDVKLNDLAKELEQLIVDESEIEKKEEEDSNPNEVEEIKIDIFNKVAKRQSRLIGLNGDKPLTDPEQNIPEPYVDFKKKVAMYNRAQILFTIHLTNNLSNQIGLVNFLKYYDDYQIANYGVETNSEKILPEDISKMMKGYVEQISNSAQIMNNVNIGLDAAMHDDIESLKKEWERLADGNKINLYDINFRTLENI